MPDPMTEERVAAVLHAAALRAREEAPTLPAAEARPTRYTVSLLPEGDVNYPAYVITVEYRGDGRWGVFRGAHCCLDADGQWSWGYAWRDGNREPATDEEWIEYHAGREAWLAAHRFDLETALRLAREAAPLVIVNGHTVTDALRDASEDEGGAA